MMGSVGPSSRRVSSAALSFVRGGHGASSLTDLGGLQQCRQGRYLGEKNMSREECGIIKFKIRAYALAVGLRWLDFSAGFFTVLFFLAARSAARESKVEAAERFRDAVARPLLAAGCGPDSTGTEGRG